MPRRARIHFVSLHSSLVNLPISLYGPLLERGVRPQGLAVHLTLVSAQKQAGRVGTEKIDAYVGWTGMASASSLAHFNSTDASDRGLETIEIDPQYAEALGFALGDVVEIGLLHDLGYAQSVAAEPVTPDDWEIIEIHASHVESTLLSQVRVAMTGQEINVWVLGRTRVRLKIASLEPSSGEKALLLTTNTEVSIAPKPHVKSKSSVSRNPRDEAKGRNKLTKLNGINGHSTDTSISSKDASARKEGPSKKRVHLMRVLPRRFFSPPGSLTDASNSDRPIVYVSRAILMSLSQDTGLPTSVFSWCASVRKLKPPADPCREQSSTAPAVPPAPRILIPNGSSGPAPSDQPSAASSQDEVVLMWSPEFSVPYGHVIFDQGVPDMNDWDLIQITFIREHERLPDKYPAEMSSENGYAVKLQHGLAGIDDILSKCVTFCLTNLALHAFSGRIRGVPGLLVTGRSGAGKTSLLQTVAKLIQEDPRVYAHSLYVDLSKCSEMPVSKFRSMLRYWMDKAAWHRPSLLLMDNVDRLLGAEAEHADSFRNRHLAELFLAMFGPSSKSAASNANGVVLLAAAESQAALHPTISASHLFQEVVSLKPPGKDARRDIIAHLVQERIDSSNIVQDTSIPLNYTALATQTEGYSATDLRDLVARAVHRAAIRSSPNESDDLLTTLVPDDFTSAQVDFVPHSLRDVKLQKSDIEWTDIGGLKETKHVLRETLEWPTKYGPIFAQSPLRLRSGLLLYGYPGCGKTLLASAVARECGLNFISIKGPELLNKYIGASEKSVRDLFERASAAKPCVLFFDEFDSIAPKRGHDSTGVTDRVVNQMLTQMDGAEGLDGVYVLAATSRPDLIDSALLRPGRLDKSLLCDMPNVEERREILECLGRKINIAASVDLDELARQTVGFSGADLQALVYNAHLEVIHDTIVLATSTATSNKAEDAEGGDPSPFEYAVLGQSETDQKKVLSRAEESAFQRRLHRILTKPLEAAESRQLADDTNRPKREITEEHFLKVFQSTRPSVPPEERERLRRIYHAFVSDRSGELPVPPEGTDVGSRVSLM